MLCTKNYTPSPGFLKSSLIRRGKEYPRVAALHGIAYVVDPTRPKIERFGWFLCVVASAIAALGIIFTLMERFQTDPMLNTLELRFDDAPLDLPKFYLCPPWKSFNYIPPPKKYDNVLYEKLFNWDFHTQFERKNGAYPDDLDDIVSLKKLFLENAPSCEHFINNITLFVSLREKQFTCSSFQIASTTAGICLIFQSTGNIIDDAPIIFGFNATMFPIRVYATIGEDTELLRHHKLHYFRFPSSIKIDLQETYTSPNAKVLTRSQRKCFFPGEQSPYNKCSLDCKIANSLKFCDCVPWYLAKDGIQECRISRYQCLDINSDKILDKSTCRCWQSCDNVVLKNVEISVLSGDEPCAINLRERSVLKFKRTVRYGWSDLFVSFGGIAGLFLGCSVLSLIEFGYYFSLRTYCGAVLSVPKSKHNVTKINVLDAGHPVNLTRYQKPPVISKRRVTFYDYIN